MAKLTPMMAQYQEIKAQQQDCVLMFRLGDFYEMFFEDAVEAAEILQITLTARGKSEDKIPMCGVPYHALDNYLAKLTRAGKKVAIAEQTTSPDGMGIVQREVARVVTPGTTFDHNILEQNANNYVAALVRGKSGFALAYSDVTTGEFRVSEYPESSDLEDEIMRLDLAEIICSEELAGSMRDFLGKFSRLCVFPFLYAGSAERDLLQAFNLKSLVIFGLENRDLATRASGMLYAYLKETQKTDLKHIGKITYQERSDFMPLNEATVRNLELFYTTRGEKKFGTLISVLDQTMNSMGGRLLRKWLLHPLLEQSLIEARHDQVDKFVQNSSLLRQTRELLSKIYDIERLLSRLSLGSGGGRDLIAMKQSLQVVPELEALVNRGLQSLPELASLIGRAIKEDCPVLVRDGGVIADGYNQELDALRSLSSEGKSFIAELQRREIERTGINSLKVKFNKVFGYYIEISKNNLAAVPDDYIRKQTLVNAERYITPELKEYEEKVLSAEDKIKELEFELFYSVRMEVVKEISKLQALAREIAEVDVLSNFAFIAIKERFCRPQFGEVFDLKNSRHPVVEKLFGDFVPNDCEMNSDANFLLITGPNMGGKSTYLRQVALTVLMAQIGSFVPCESAMMPIFDQIFTRVGASDNLSKGESTFMVEMQEVAYILNKATDRSLIILDEVGRGTSTYDGVSIAWAIVEHIHDEIGAKTLFATHYHELVELADSLACGKNLSVAVRENADEGVVFLYKIVEGAVDKSYGIEVAKLAGLPVGVVGRARGVLGELETKHIRRGVQSPGQMGMFREASSLDKKHKKVIDGIKEMDTENMTPLQALGALDEIKKNC
ncbi:DNA mismatch repair protein MutS [Candidatus Gracilibacteria bacterium]|nr:DNA mismatch repair protein MutS [Candidatus Gracilibacteria bacterium]